MTEPVQPQPAPPRCDRCGKHVDDGASLFMVWCARHARHVARGGQCEVFEPVARAAWAGRAT